MTLEYVNYIMWAPQEKLEYFFYHSYICTELGNLGGVRVSFYACYLPPKF
jgi:hypothetical protein